MLSFLLNARKYFIPVRYERTCPAISWLRTFSVLLESK